MYVRRGVAPGLQASSSLNSGLGEQDGPAEPSVLALTQEPSWNDLFLCHLHCRRDGCPQELSGREGGFRTSLSQDTVFSFACLRCTPLGGVGQLVGNLFPTRKDSYLGDRRTEIGGSGRRWGLGSQSLKSGLRRSRSGARRI